MTKSPSPLLGFNNNVRHNGCLYHIQTEDSGIKYPHVITHLFGDGGRILKTLKTSYEDLLGSEDLATKVRALMKSQHKAMFIALRDGDFDESIPGAPTAKSPTPPPTAQPSDTRESGTFRRPAPASQQHSPAGPTGDFSRFELAAQNALKTSDIHAEPVEPSPGHAQTSPAPNPRMRPRLVSPPKSPKHADSKPPTDRPSSDYGRAKPSAARGSVFGETVLSSKSLDEVILDFIVQESDIPDDNGTPSSR